MTDEEAENDAAPATTVADMVTGPATLPLFRMTDTLPVASEIPLAVVGVPSFGVPM